MRKPENTVKFPEKVGRNVSQVKTFETVEEAVAEAKAQAAAANVPPSSIMVSFRDGYVTGDGEVHAANGVAAPPPTKPKEPEINLQVPATESYAPGEVEVDDEPEPVVEETEPVEDDSFEAAEEAEAEEIATEATAFVRSDEYLLVDDEGDAGEDEALDSQF